MAVSLPSIPEALFESRTVEDDLPCRRCGYNLRSLQTTGRCPECGIAVGLSVQGDLLRYSEPAWLDKLVRGLKLILWGALVSILTFITVGIFSGALGPFTSGALTFVGDVMGAIRAWLLTEPDPAGLNESQYLTARKIIRVTLIIGLGGDFVSLFTDGTTLPLTIHSALVVAGMLLGLVGIVSVCAQLKYLGQLAMRIPNHGLTGRANFLVWGCGITMPILLIYSDFGPSRGPIAGRIGTAIIGCFAIVLLLALLIFLIMDLALVINMMLALRRQAWMARSTWAAAASLDG